MKPEKKPAIKDIDFHYIKTPCYRTYHVDGIFGGLTPRGNLYVELFVERKPTPNMVKHAVKDSGEVGEELFREGKSGFVREIECGLSMDIQTAKSLQKWLESKISEFEEFFPRKIKDD
jgi:hypothetical protein